MQLLVARLPKRLNQALPTQEMQVINFETDKVQARAAPWGELVALELLVVRVGTSTPMPGHTNAGHPDATPGNSSPVPATRSPTPVYHHCVHSHLWPIEL